MNKDGDAPVTPEEIARTGEVFIPAPEVPKGSIMTTDIKDRVNALNQMILDGKIMEAMSEFYADDVVMGENDAEPTVGLQPNLEREQAFGEATTWHGLELRGVAVGDQVSMTEWWMDFHYPGYGARLSFTQVAVARWRDGKIFDERFYYSPQPVQD
jgi:hypothetical protein